MLAGRWRPTRLHIGSGKDYKLGWFNIDILEASQPDAVLDLARPQAWPQVIASDSLGDVELREASLSTIYANNVLEHVADLPRLMTNCLLLLQDGGEMQIEVPHERAKTAWQDPTHVRAMNGNSWIYYADWFWYLGWFDWRFHVKQLVYLDAALQECDEGSAHFMRVTLQKAATTLAEKMNARTMQPGFGGVPHDLDRKDHGAAVEASATDEERFDASSAQLVELE
jgi:SAM-dependent methyltransferase